MTIRRGLLAIPFVFTGWIAVMALVMRLTDAAPAAVVPWPSAAFLNQLPNHAAVIDAGGLAVTFANRPDLAADLYEAGAWLVLPAGLTGCLPLSARQKEVLRRG